MFQYLADFAGTRLFTPQKLIFNAILPSKRVAISTKAKKGTPLRESASFELSGVKM